MDDILFDAYMPAVRHSFLNEESFLLSRRDKLSGKITVLNPSTQSICDIDELTGPISDVIVKLYSLSDGIESVGLLLDGYAFKLAIRGDSIKLINSFARDFFGDEIECIGIDKFPSVSSDSLPKALLIENICAAIIAESPTAAVEAAYMLEACAKEKYINKLI